LLYTFTHEAEAQKESVKLNEMKQLQVLDSLGQYHWQTASYSQALVHYRKALRLAEQIKDEKWISRVLNYLGVIYENKGDFDASLKYHFRALRKREKSNQKREIAISCVNIGITYSSAGQIEKGLEYYFKCLKINEEIKEARLDAHAHYHISTAYRRLKQYEKAIAHARKALRLALKIREKSILMDAQNGLGLVATAQKRYAEARNYYQNVCNLATADQDWLVLTNSLLHLAENYQQSQDYPKAIEYTQKSLLSAQKHELKAEQQLAYQILSALYASQGNYAEAYQYHLKFNVLKDTLFNLQKSRQIAELTTQYETEKKEQQIQLLEKDKRLNQITIQRQTFFTYSLLSGIVLLLLLAGFIFYSYRNRQKILEQKILIQKQNEKITQAQNAKLEEQLLLEENLHKAKQEQFEEQIAHKERELASTAMHIFQKNEMLNQLQTKLNDLDTEVRSRIKPLFQEIQRNLNLDEDWANFQLHFSQVHPYFFSRLQQNFPSLTQHEMKLLAYIRMKLSNKEIAQILHISPKSVEMSRYRLKKKIELEAEDSLDEWVMHC
jgi:tetratricopeptide (TPR) repeat protein